MFSGLFGMDWFGYIRFLMPYGSILLYISIRNTILSFALTLHSITSSS